MRRYLRDGRSVVSHFSGGLMWVSWQLLLVVSAVKNVQLETEAAEKDRDARRILDAAFHATDDKFFERNFAYRKRQARTTLEHGRLHYINHAYHDNLVSIFSHFAACTSRPRVSTQQSPLPTVFARGRSSTSTACPPGRHTHCRI